MVTVQLTYSNDGGVYSITDTVAGTAICLGVGTAIGFAISALGFILFDIVGWRDDMKGLVN